MTLKEYNICVDTYADCLFRFMVKHVGCQDTAHDLVQDAFEKLWNHHHQVEVSKVKGWLFKTAYNGMIDYFRNHKRIELTEILPETAVESQYSDVKEILQVGVSRLPEIQRTVLLLRDYEGYSYQEIGEITGLSESQVKVYIYRARVTLKKFIGSMKVLV